MRVLPMILASIGLAMVEASSHVSLGWYSPPFSSIISSRPFYTAGMALILMAPYIHRGLYRAAAFAMLGGAVEDTIYWVFVWHPPHSWAPYYPVIWYIPIVPIALAVSSISMLALARRFSRAGPRRSAGIARSGRGRDS